MGEDVEVVGDKSADDLWADALDRLEKKDVPLLDRDAGEFSRQDAQDRWGWKTNTTVRRLKELVAEGELGSAERMDPQTRRVCLGYWWIEEGEEAE